MVPPTAGLCLGPRTRCPLQSGPAANTVRSVVVVPAASVEAGNLDRTRESEQVRPVQSLVVDRQPLFLAALGILLVAPPLSARVTTCPRSDMAVEIVRRGGVDIIFCELRAEPISGPELIRALAEESVNVPVILLGDLDDEPQLSQALHSPAAGLFTKDVSVDEFLVGVQAVLGGHRAIGAALMGRVLDRLANQAKSQARRSANDLSQTEREILVMIGRAESIADIAAGRRISPKTVRNHLAKIYRKLGLHGRTEAMLWAARTGLTRP